MAKSPSKKDEQDFIEGFNGVLESEKERHKITPAQLAIRLSECEKDSPAYIHYSHELTRKIASVQATATYVGAVIGVIGVVIGFMLGLLV